jgi:hypothetical protein
MLRFKKFLAEGGNLPFPHDPNDPSKGNRVSDSIDSSRRAEQQGHFKEFFNSLDTGFKQKHGHNLFGNALTNNRFASGSAEGYMDPNISHERFAKAKPTMGDFDVQIPQEHREKLNQYLQPGQVHGQFKVAHVRNSGSQTHAVVQHLGTGQHHQIDFEPVEYDPKTQEPTPYERFAHNSHINDLEQGLKGVHHKYLLQSITAAGQKPGLISKMTGRGKARAETREEGNYNPNTFSVDKGLRQKWEKVGEENGKDVVREKSPSESEYTKDLPTIYKTLFNRDASEQDIADIHHTGGLVDHIKKHIPQEHHGKVFDAFVNKLWHPTAQETSVDRDTDKKVKQNAYDFMARHFPGEALARQQKTDQQKAEYYDENNPKKFKMSKKSTTIPSTETENNPTSIVKESEDEHHHVVFGAGRFTGPTVEHHKLLSKIFNTPADSHRVYVMGPSSKEQTTDKDPLTVDEKVAQLKKLYPEKADSFIPGNERHTSNPQKALVHTWHSLKKPGRKVHLTVIAGSGEEGIKNKSSAGGSLEGYKSLVDKYNKTRFPQSTNPDGSTRGGDLRMDYESTNFVPNERGTVSGSVMRNAAKKLDHNNPSHVAEFKKLLHPDYSDEDAQELMKTIKKRSKPVSESLFYKVKQILSI